MCVVRAGEFATDYEKWWSSGEKCRALCSSTIENRATSCEGLVWGGSGSKWIGKSMQTSPNTRDRGVVKVDARGGRIGSSERWAETGTGVVVIL